MSDSICAKHKCRTRQIRQCSRYMSKMQRLGNNAKKARQRRRDDVRREGKGGPQDAGRRGSCDDEGVAVLEISQEGLLSGTCTGASARRIMGADGQMWRTEDTYLRSSFAFCTAANAAALTLDASKPDGSAHTRHIGQFAGWSRYEAGTCGKGGEFGRALSMGCRARSPRRVGLDSPRRRGATPRGCAQTAASGCGGHEGRRGPCLRGH